MKKLVLCGILVAAVTVLAVPVWAEPQPHMEAALKSLVKAKEELLKATSDKGGHRVKAIQAIDVAITEVKKGIAFDNKH